MMREHLEEHFRSLERSGMKDKYAHRMCEQTNRFLVITLLELTTTFCSSFLAMDNTGWLFLLLK